MSNNYLDDWELKASKALVALFGPTEAAKQLGIPRGTMLWRCQKYGWKKATKQPTGEKDIGDIIIRAVERSKQISTVHLAQYVEKASIDAANLDDPLASARKVADVGKVYNTLWPHEKEQKLIEGEILIGVARVEDAKQVKGEVIDADIREGLPDRGQEGH